MGFIKFTEVGKNFAPRVILSPSGVISFNQGARKKFSLDLYSHVVMYMDADDHTIGFELVHDENLDGANKLRRIRRDGVDINGRAFLKHFKLKLKKPLSFRVGEDTATGWLFMRLDEGEVVGAASVAAPQPQNHHPVYEDDDIPSSQSTRPTEAQKSPAIAALKTLSNAVPANAQVHRPQPTPVAASQAVTRTRGVKAMLSELLQD